MCISDIKLYNCVAIANEFVPDFLLAIKVQQFRKLIFLLGLPMNLKNELFLIS